MICRGNTCDSVMIRPVWDLLVLTLSDSVSQHFKLKDEIEALFSSACLWHSCGAGQSEPERSQHDGGLALSWSGLLVLCADEVPPISGFFRQAHVESSNPGSSAEIGVKREVVARTPLGRCLTGFLSERQRLNRDKLCCSNHLGVIPRILDNQQANLGPAGGTRQFPWRNRRKLLRYSIIGTLNVRLPEDPFICHPWAFGRTNKTNRWLAWCVSRGGA